MLQGEKVLAGLQELLNPSQVFNLLEKDPVTGKVVGPRKGLDAMHRVKNLVIVAAGGDGTVGWVLDAIDKAGYAADKIPVSVLPLGTGNDLARAFKFGGGYGGFGGSAAANGRRFSL